MWVDYDGSDDVWVCTEHKRFLPCRACNREPWRTVYPHSCAKRDIEIVRKFQQGS